MGQRQFGGMAQGVLAGGGFIPPRGQGAGGGQRQKRRAQAGDAHGGGKARQRLNRFWVNSHIGQPCAGLRQQV
jgi:hypothetical protein